MYARAIKIGVPAGLISALTVPLAHFIYIELFVSDETITQYSFISLFAAVVYIPFAIIFCTLLSAALLKSKLRRLFVFLLSASTGVIGVGLYYLGLVF